VEQLVALGLHQAPIATNQGHHGPRHCLEFCGWLLGGEAAEFATTLALDHPTSSSSAAVLQGAHLAQERRMEVQAAA
jgi:hypothetical protein